MVVVLMRLAELFDTHAHTHIHKYNIFYCIKELFKLITHYFVIKLNRETETDRARKKERNA